MSRRIKRGDTVVILAGEDQGRTGKVLKVDPRAGKVYVEGIGMQFKHVRRSQQNPKGGRVERERGLDLSNVALWSDKTSTPQRFRIEERDGRRVRVGTKDGEVKD